MFLSSSGGYVWSKQFPAGYKRTTVIKFIMGGAKAIAFLDSDNTLPFVFVLMDSSNGAVLASYKDTNSNI